MAERPVSLATEVRFAATFLTRVPLPPLPALDIPVNGLAGAVRAFPLVGALIGLAGGLAYLLLNHAIGPLAAALVAVLITVTLTGCLHEDGLADVADGFGGGRDKASKLAIMRDSRIGSYGVVALIGSVGLRVALLSDLRGWAGLGALVAAAALSRAAVPFVMASLDPARTDGLGAMAGKPTEQALTWCGALGVLIAFLCVGWPVLLAAPSAALAAVLVAWAAHKQIGGQTGDVLGAVQQVAEIAVLFTVVLL